MQTKEELYDEQISPLMAQIIAVCNEYQIAHVCSFSLEPQGGLCCTTANTSDEFEPPEEFRECVRVLRGNGHLSPLMVTTRDGDGNVKEVTAIMP